MKDAYRSRVSRTEKIMDVLVNKPIYALAWLIYDHFGKSFEKSLVKMFPLFAVEWTKIYNEILP